ncbi:diaminobutyrate acetyltransferase [Isoptericola sp. NEAU-Y5]|uniref:L-2,4-diaminobutyric acid acetyltransferase n=1 Tax=Isoptericola luteus TaxID=2879484 RepID=A0ABS7ZG40_9MICO|nr:diaminobutyrate acetyltransferase [Isoptericola sp. NEAU-Y5]MCA5892819.1 diaminobutyrate acetyltransferase [Isoptericola sp. NEAU-Y5]
MDTTDTATTDHPTDSTTLELTVRPPTTADGGAMWRLARDSGTLDLNTSYAYLLLATHFADTCRVAFAGDDAVGFVAAYRLPQDPSALFVWQVAVDERLRGRRVAARLLDAAVDETDGITRLETTVTTDNAASRRLFSRWAQRRGAALTEREGFTAAHFPDGHDAEPLLVIEPLVPLAGADPGH